MYDVTHESLGMRSQDEISCRMWIFRYTKTTAMENPAFVDVFPRGKGWFSVAMLVYYKFKWQILRSLHRCFIESFLFRLFAPPKHQSCYVFFFVRAVCQVCFFGWPASNRSHEPLQKKNKLLSSLRSWFGNQPLVSINCPGFLGVYLIEKIRWS